MYDRQWCTGISFDSLSELHFDAKPFHISNFCTNILFHFYLNPSISFTHISSSSPFRQSHIALIQSCTPNQSLHYAHTTHISCTKHRFKAVIISLLWHEKLQFATASNNYDQRQSHGYLSKHSNILSLVLFPGSLEHTVSNAVGKKRIGIHAYYARHIKDWCSFFSLFKV